MYMHTQYYDLQNRAVGRYGYEWVDSDVFLDNDMNVMRQLQLKVTKYASGSIDPTYLNIGIKEQEIGKEKEVYNNFLHVYGINSYPLYVCDFHLVNLNYASLPISDFTGYHFRLCYRPLQHL